MLIYPDFASLPKIHAEISVSSDRGEGRCRAFAANERITIRLHVPRLLCASDVTLILYRDDDHQTEEMSMELAEFDDAADDWSLTLHLQRLCLSAYGGLFYFAFCANTPYGAVLINRDGSLCRKMREVSFAQLSAYDPEYTLPGRFFGSMMYQIFVDRFDDGGCPIHPGEGKIYDPDWEHGVPEYTDRPGEELKNNRFFGGNLWGVAKRLDYIASLGVDTIYLCPIFEAASNHKYDTGDYRRVDRAFGGDAALDHLIKECHRRNMKLILDGVFNHTGADSVYFNQQGRYPGIGAAQSPDSPYSARYFSNSSGR